MTKWTQEDIDGITNKADKKVNASQPASFALGRLKAGAMNKTEAAYANYLEKQKPVRRCSMVCLRADEPEAGKQMLLPGGLPCNVEIRAAGMPRS